MRCQPLRRALCFRRKMESSVFAIFGANALVIAAIGYIVRSAISHYLNKDIAAFKESLKSEVTKELEGYKSELETERLKLQIAYGGLYEKRANAILAIYDDLIKLEGEVYVAIHASEEGIERRKRFFRELKTAMSSYVQSRILLPECIDAQLKAFYEELSHNVFRYNTLEQKMRFARSEERFEQLCKEQDEALEIVENGIPILKELLICEMRKVLGAHIG
ncbi:phosphoprotein [Vibrio cholerae V51]|nr:hypothetical protein DN33_3562 [Vibrio cholerae]KNA44193.1 thiosulfate-binding protein [Vibrio cholerae V51]KNA52119.1 phosphoprotein [Vibrio cholerae V51]